VKKVLFLSLLLIIVAGAFYLTKTETSVSSAYTDELLVPEEVLDITPKKKFMTSIDIDYLRSLDYVSSGA